FFLYRPRRPPTSPLFPYTTLFRSRRTPGSRPRASNRSSDTRGASGGPARRPPRSSRAASSPRRRPGPSPYQVYDVFVPSLVHVRSEEHTSELQSRGHLVCRLLLEK